MKKAIKKKTRKNPALGVRTDINKLIGILEDLKVTLSQPSSPFYDDDLKDAKFGIKVMSTEIGKKL